MLKVFLIAPFFLLLSQYSASQKEYCFQLLDAESGEIIYEDIEVFTAKKSRAKISFKEEGVCCVSKIRRKENLTIDGGDFIKKKIRRKEDLKKRDTSVIKMEPTSEELVRRYTNRISNYSSEKEVIEIEELETIKEVFLALFTPPLNQMLSCASSLFDSDNTRMFFMTFQVDEEGFVNALELLEKTTEPMNCLVLEKY